jgi:hypothetical protein
VCPSARDLSIALLGDRADDAAASKTRAAREPSPENFRMTPEELFAALAKKNIPPFATSVLGFTLGSLIDAGASEEEVKALCHMLVEKIMAAVENPEIIETNKKFSSLIETAMGGR